MVEVEPMSRVSMEEKRVWYHRILVACSLLLSADDALLVKLMLS